jgi:DNA-binding CsgD family transcriptional regulator
VPTKFRSTLRGLALSFAADVVKAVGTANLAQPSQPEASRQTLDERVSQAADGWGARYKLSGLEVDILRRAALGETPAQIARRRGTSVQMIEARAARILRRTRDGSLESAANRLLRHVIDRSSRAAATAAPRGGAAGGKLGARIEELRHLAAQPADASVRYAMGAIVKDLKSRPGTYGESAVSVAAAAIGEDMAGLYRFASVAERWGAREVRALLADESVSWSHLVALARIESRTVRDRFLRRVRREKLPLRELVAALEREGLV